MTRTKARDKARDKAMDKDDSKGGHRSPYGWDMVAPYDQIIDHNLATARLPPAPPSDNTELALYEQRRKDLRRREHALSFDWKCTQAATPKEEKADRILRALRRHDEEHVYGASPARRRGGDDGPLHPRFAGDHFLSNRALIDRTKVFGLSRRMPKGAHLHIHFNACLGPGVLLGVARAMDHMFITSDVSLADARGRRRCRIQFSIMAIEESEGDLFDPGYGNRAPMRFDEFLEAFPRHCPPHGPDGAERGGGDAMAWLEGKLVTPEEEAYDPLQTVAGAWDGFNARTQMMKGLFNYEMAYRTYTRRCLEDFVADNIQYAEIRPNFMDTNQVWTDDGSGKIDNVGIMQMIMDEYEKFQAESTGYFGGLKVIYCCPRSWPNDKVARGLAECLAFKKRWPRWIAGFDLVGEEGKGKPLSAFVPEFLTFRRDCAAAGVDVPFLFHCGETLEAGSEMDENLLDALLLGSRRIGHGFSLARHPYVMERMKRDGVCLEVCPISNEVLGLTPRANGHSVYNLLANDVHCTVNSDNGTLFK